MPRNHRDSNGAYELVEGGYGGPPDSIGKRGSGRFTWKKLAVGAVVFIGLVWIFGPRVKERYGYGSEEESDVSKSPTTNAGTTKGGVTTMPTGTHHYVDIDDDLAASPSSSGSGSSTTHPTTYDSDLHPSQTTYCTTLPPNSSLPLVQYALMIDAGSTGSRIHIYKFNNCRSGTPTFEYEVFKMTQPGLSYYAGHAEDAAGSLDVLLDEAMRVVPEEMRMCTPVAVKATAGLRLLPGTQSAEILEAVGKRIGEVYPFKLVEGRDGGGGVVIMDGKDEGVYAWITANYLMGTIKEGEDSDDEDGPEGGSTTYAVLDLGGASTQIVFEPVFEKEEGAMEEGEHKYDLKFAGRNHVLYQHSYLDYGLMRARVHVHRLVNFISSVRTNGKEVGEVVGNPCLAKGTRRTVQIEDEKRNVTMAGEDVGSFDGCNRLMQLVLAKDA